MNETKLRFYRVSYPDFGRASCVVTLEGMTEELNEMAHYGEVGDVMRVEIVEITQEEKDALPEFRGW